MTTFLLKLRNRHFFALDLAALAIIPPLALALRLDGFQAVSRYAEGLLTFTLIGLVVRLLIFWRAGLYSRYWRYASVDEIALIGLAVATATAINTLLFFTSRLLPLCPSALLLPCSPAPWLPRSIPFIDGMLTLIAVGGSRFSLRLAEHWRRRGCPAGRRALIIGAGDAGRLIAREMQTNPQLGLEPVGFIDDDPTKCGVKIQGLPVLGDRERIPEIVRDYKISQAIIAMPTAPGKTIRHFFELCEKAGIEAKIIPGIYDLLSGRVSVSQIRNVEIEDLLRRDPVKIETDEVVRMIRGKRVLVTGAGGSIGSEICRQAAQYGAAELILLGHGENSIFRITRELQGKKGIREKGNKEVGEQGDKGKGKKGDKGERGIQSPIPGPGQVSNTQYPISNTQYPIPIVPVIADIRDRSRLQTIFEKYRPHIVFHAAAHKHVPLMECNVAEAVTNNVLGTKCLIEAAQQANVECFVLISTDKAVNPTSVMGVTKRVAEKLVEAAAACSGRGFVAVRFGNVLGSRGSVVNIFREQIARGGPVTVTHPDMLRYFMTIPEAVQLVLQAAAIGQGGEVFVLDMGKPVPIAELARDLIRLSGLEVGRDIDIEFIGVRPGEKLFEELFAEGESFCRTHHEKIFVYRNGLLEGKREKGERERGSMGEGETNHASRPILSSSKDFTPHVSRFAFQVDALIAAAEHGEPDEVRRLLQVLVPEYRPATDG